MNGQGWGLLMLPLAAFMAISMGMEIWAALIGSAALFAVAGAVLDIYDWGVMSALPLRVLGILDNDLLQALPLYGWLGMLLQHSGISRSLHKVLMSLFRKATDAPSLVTLSMGLLMAPMIGSVASTARLLSSAATADEDEPHPHASTPEIASLSAASTLGLTLPPSLVLLLFGDAMMAAHTQASTLTQGAVLPHQILNTQDVFRLMLLPAIAVTVGWIVLSQLLARRRAPTHPTPIQTPTLADWVKSLALLLMLISLLVLVATGRMVAVEASAIACTLLALALLLTRALPFRTWLKTVEHALTLTGSLLGLLLGATTLSLVMKMWAADAWVEHTITHSNLPALLISALLVLVLMACAWVMDAFEMIFVVIPVIAPSLMSSLGDASQATVVMLLLLQTAFLLPPFGYAILFAQAGHGHTKTPLWKFIAYAMVPALVACGLLAWPAPLHWLDPAEQVQSREQPLSSDALDDLMRSMSSDAQANVGADNNPDANTQQQSQK